MRAKRWTLMDAMRGGLKRKETSVTLENVDSALDFLVRLDPGALISRGSKRCKEHRNFAAAQERATRSAFSQRSRHYRTVRPWLETPVPRQEPNYTPSKEQKL